MEFARRLRQLVALFFVFLLSAEIPGQTAHLAQHLIRRGPGFAAEALDHALQLVAIAATLLCALYLSQQRLGVHRLLASFPPREPIPLALHGLGLLSGLITLLLRR